MKLRSLQLHGFKSFPDRTKIRFHDGMTTIVGPNGCGKSNIADAIRWVLGEQRPRAIRGARMEEVIFQGTATRRAVNRGAVSMVVSNEDGKLPVPYGEVEIGRIVFRDGGSDYRLNRASCRLRDILDLCRDTGLGANAYTVIEGRMIDAILSDHAGERRSLFEEAAGVGKYKDRRRAALSRLGNSEADLLRLEDLIAEVRSKVRSLARQRGKAERYRTMRKRRLNLEVALARLELRALQERLGELDAAERRSGEEGVRLATRLAAGEAALEERKAARLDAERERTEVAGRMERAARGLARVEREVAVAQERIEGGEGRLAQLRAEEESLAQIETRSVDEAAALKDQYAECNVQLTKCNEELSTSSSVAAEVRARMERGREGIAELEERARGVHREMARAGGEREAAGRHARELGVRMERLESDSRRIADAARELDSQGDLFSSRSRDAAQRVTEASRAAEDLRGQLAQVRTTLREAVEEERLAEARESSLAAELRTLQRSSEWQDGGEDLAQSAVEAQPGRALGLLSDYIRVDEDVAAVVDDILGRMSAAVLAPDSEAGEAVAEWYRLGGGRSSGLVLLPLDSAPPPGGPIPAGVRAQGEGAPWVEALLGGVRLGGSDRGAPGGGGRWSDLRGAIHLLPDEMGEGHFARRSRASALQGELESASAAAAGARAARIALSEECERLEADAEAAAERLLASRDEVRAAEAESDAHGSRRRRLERQREETAHRIRSSRAARERALGQEEEAERELALLRDREEATARKLREVRARQDETERSWELARDTEAEIAVRAARLESEAARLQGRLNDNRAASRRAAERRAELAREAEELGRRIAEARAARDAGGDELERLFAERRGLERHLAERDRALEIVATAVADADRELRETRGLEREAVGRGHALAMELQEARSSAARIEERLEAEWGQSLATLIAESEPVEGDSEELAGEAAELGARLARIGAVNMLAVEEHAEESERLEFLEGQHEDLVAARRDLQAAVRRINATATELFEASFEAIQENFRRTFRHLFSGGDAKVRLAEPEDPLESPIEIQAAPEGKRTQRIDLLSGGERALTALALLFGIYLVKPSPFCVLDEVDAPLDESNIGRFVRLLHDFKGETQFVVITHNPRTIEAADWIYGVTMEEPGISSLVGVQLERHEAPASAS